MDAAKESRWPLALRCAGILLVVATVGFTFDRLLVREGVPRTDILIESNVLTGIVAAVFYAYLSKYERERRRQIQQRLRTIADMNHHIRNALQVITYAVSTEKRENSMEMLKDSVNRIEWALREVLPGYAAESREPVQQPLETSLAIAQKVDRNKAVGE